MFNQQKQFERATIGSKKDLKERHNSKTFVFGEYRDMYGNWVKDMIKKQDAGRNPPKTRYSLTHPKTATAIEREALTVEGVNVPDPATRYEKAWRRMQDSNQRTTFRVPTNGKSHPPVRDDKGNVVLPENIPAGKTPAYVRNARRASGKLEGLENTPGESYWLKNVGSAFFSANALRFMPKKDMTNVEIHNAVIRFSLYLFAVVFILTGQIGYIAIPLSFMLISILLYRNGIMTLDDLSDVLLDKEVHPTITPERPMDNQEMSAGFPKQAVTAFDARYKKNKSSVNKGLLVKTTKRKQKKNSEKILEKFGSDLTNEQSDQLFKSRMKKYTYAGTDFDTFAMRNQQVARDDKFNYLSRHGLFPKKAYAQRLTRQGTPITGELLW